MAAHLLGTLATLAAFGLVGIAFLVGLVAFRRGRRGAALRALAAAGVLVTLYGLGIALPALLGTTRVLESAAELSFCGFDCHLHVAVTAAEPEPPASADAPKRIVVGVQVRSDAVRAPEHPSLLRFRLVDQRGREYPPAAFDTGLPPFTQDLAAGESYSRTLVFVLPPDADPRGVRVTWHGWLDYWVLGPAGTFMRRKVLLALPAGQD